MLDRRDWQRTDGDVPPMRAGFDGVQPVLRGLRQRTQADYCRREAEGAAGAVDEPWVLLAMAWAKLALGQWPIAHHSMHTAGPPARSKMILPTNPPYRHARVKQKTRVSARPPPAAIATGQPHESADMTAQPHVWAPS